MSATTFTVDDVFIITGWGLVLAGIVNGDFNVGDMIVIDLYGRKKEREIIGINSMHRTAENKFGLLIKCESEEEQKEIRHSDIAGRQFSIYSLCKKNCY